MLKKRGADDYNNYTLLEHRPLIDVSVRITD